jgi:hypothetical protein
MTPFPPELEALMPEPATHRYMSHGHSSRWQLAGKAVPPDAEPLFTADQVRQAMLDATERAAKLALDKAYDAMFDLKGDKVTRFDAQTAIRKLRDAASIGRSTSRGEGE